MILEVDVGNTAFKWRILNAKGDVLSAGRALQGVDFLPGVHQCFGSLSLVRVACVAKEKVRQNLCRQITALWEVEIQIAQTSKSKAGLTIAYKDPARLGVDRWLAMLAAYAKTGGAVCVIDCGSAITVDRVCDEGVHRGGYIVPGVAMQVKTLMSSTGQIRLEQSLEMQSVGWGASTEEAVNFGVLRMVSSFIDGIVDEIDREAGECKIYLTGGDAEKLQSWLRKSQRVCLCPDLVLNGLAIALA